MAHNEEKWQIRKSKGKKEEKGQDKEEKGQDIDDANMVRNGKKMKKCHDKEERGR